MLLVLTCAGIVFGVVLSFMTNNYMQQGIRNLTTTAREGVFDAQLFLNETSQELNFMLDTNYGELQATLEVTLDEKAKNTITDLENETKTESVSQLNAFVQELPRVRSDLERVKTLSASLRTNASELNTCKRRRSRNSWGA